MKRFVLVDGGKQNENHEKTKCLHKYIRLSPQYLLEGAR